MNTKQILLIEKHFFSEEKFKKCSLEKDAIVLSKYKALYYLPFCLAIVCEKSLENNYKTITTTHQTKCSFFLNKRRLFTVR